MVSRNREQPANDTSLLFTTMYIIGLPVDVQVKDGSIYSGIFHTACLDKGYGIVLKMARMTRKGNTDADLAKGALIDTLVILSGDLVQVVAKGVPFPADGFMGNLAGENSEGVTGTVEAQSCHIDLEREHKLLKPEKVSERISMEVSLENCENGILDQNGENMAASCLGKMSNDVEDGTLPAVEKGYELCKAAEEPLESVPGAKNDKVEDTSVALNIAVNEGQLRGGCQGKDESDDQNCEISISPESGHSDILTSNASTSSSHLLDITSNLSTSPTGYYPSKSHRNSKEFKLNPCAETFLPSFTNPRSTSIASVGYMPNSSSALPVAGSQPGAEINPFMARASLPVKFVQSNNPLAGYSSSGSQYYSQPVVGHLSGRQQPVRYGAQNQPVQTGPAYVHPNAQTVMVGRSGHAVYVHPFSHDPMQGAPILPQGSTRPFFVPQQAPLPKHQGSAAHPLQLCMVPSFIAGAPQPLSMPSNISISPPFTTIRPLPVPAVNSVVCSKFLL